MGGLGSGDRKHSARELKLKRIDKAWKNVEVILDGDEEKLKPYQKKASLDIVLRTAPQEIKGEGFGSSTNVYNIIREIRESQEVDKSPLAVDNGHSLHTGRTRHISSDKEIPKQEVSGKDM